jgi:hypothetical protein
MPLNKGQIIFIIILIALIVPLFYLVQYLDSVFGDWWNIVWIAFVIVIAIFIRKTGLLKRIPQTPVRKYSLINTAIIVASLSGILIYTIIITGYVSLPLLLVFGGFIALGIVIHVIRVKIGK